MKIAQTSFKNSGFLTTSRLFVGKTPIDVLWPLVKHILSFTKFESP